MPPNGGNVKIFTGLIAKEFSAVNQSFIRPANIFTDPTTKSYTADK